MYSTPELNEKTSTRPFRHCPGKKRIIFRETSLARTVDGCSDRAEQSSPKPHRGAPKARVDCDARVERSLVFARKGNGLKSPQFERRLHDHHDIRISGRKQPINHRPLWLPWAWRRDILSLTSHHKRCIECARPWHPGWKRLLIGQARTTGETDILDERAIEAWILHGTEQAYGR